HGPVRRRPRVLECDDPDPVEGPGRGIGAGHRALRKLLKSGWRFSAKAVVASRCSGDPKYDARLSTIIGMTSSPRTFSALMAVLRTRITVGLLASSPWQVRFTRSCA